MISWLVTCIYHDQIAEWINMLICLCMAQNHMALDVSPYTWSYVSFYFCSFGQSQNY